MPGGVAGDAEMVSPRPYADRKETAGYINTSMFDEMSY